ncbi:PepSY domain-containing protein [Kangiella shandongensis]|uniref:PepSY domain-containing protein n=1 Tax=Kangiella shandongensis TaxID=2763258 RepID=UPI001CBEDE51|nr:PepSY domain-containing protein [Kangiella shandongensis]
MIKKLTLILFGLIAFAGSSEAASQKQLPVLKKPQAEQCSPVGKGAAMSTVARQTKGKVLSASLNARAKPPVYRVKVLTDSGRVRHYYVNACNGRLM